jgi:DNA polymerase-4/DNA polymerase V
MNDFEYRGSEVKLTRPSAHPLELCEVLRGLFDELYRREDLYRSTGVILAELKPDRNVQYTLFESPLQAEKVRDLYEAVDEMREKFGKHCLHLGAAHPIDALGKGRRGTPTVREQTTFFGETKRKHLPLPVLHVKV